MIAPSMSPLFRTVRLASVLLPALACAQTTQQEGFAQGKGYRDENGRAAAAIQSATAQGVPGRDTARESDLQGLYGAPMPEAGQAKVAECAARTPGSDDYANQECATINYLRRHPDQRPRTAVSRSEPAVATGATVRAAPRAFTGDQPGLGGTYSACIDRTTHTPLQLETERCQVGHAVTQGSCRRTLELTYTWQPYAGQDGAELAHARCAAGTVRGDRLALQASTSFRETDVPCAAQGHGTGTGRAIVRIDCQGAAHPHGYDARACSAPPRPPLLDPPRTTAQCTTMPRTAAHCFRPDGSYAGKSQVPVFEDHWNDSDCAAFDAARGVIAN